MTVAGVAVLRCCTAACERRPLWNVGLPNQPLVSHSPVMKLTITLLTLAGGLLPALGVLRLWRDVDGRRRRLRALLAKVEEIKNDPTLSPDERSRRLEQEAPTESTWSDVLHIRERIELVSLEQAPEITVPAVLASAGFACATVASLLSTWLD